MSKFVCNCGQVISDVKYPSPANFTIFAEQALCTFIAESGRILAELKSADSDGTRQEWINSKFGEGYPSDASDAEVIEDLMAIKVRSLSVCVVRCDACGRLHIQRETGSNDYAAFIPERIGPASAN
jgi:hypothetical protein